MKYTEYDVSADQNAAEEMVKVSGQMGVPVIIIDGQIVVGFNRERLQTLLSGAGHVRFGITVADADRIARQKGAIPIFGALVGEVATGSLGDKAGLKSGDIITEISGTRVSNAADAQKVLGGLRPGNIVTLLFLRGDETRKSEIIV